MQCVHLVTVTRITFPDGRERLMLYASCKEENPCRMSGHNVVLSDHPVQEEIEKFIEGIGVYCSEVCDEIRETIGRLLEPYCISKAP